MLMTQRAYARHRGVHHSSVQLAIARGRLSTTQGGLVDSSAADAAWPGRAGASPSKRKVTRTAEPSPRAAPARGGRGRSRMPEQRRLARVLGGIAGPADRDAEWLEVMDARELVLAEALERELDDLASALVGMGEDEVRAALAEALERGGLAGEREWARRFCR